MTKGDHPSLHILDHLGTDLYPKAQLLWEMRRERQQQRAVAAADVDKLDAFSGPRRVVLCNWDVCGSRREPEVVGVEHIAVRPRAEVLLLRMLQHFRGWYQSKGFMRCGVCYTNTCELVTSW